MALAGMRHRDRVQSAGAEIGFDARPVVQSRLHVQTRFARQRCQQFDLETLRPALVVQVLEGREIAVAAVKQGVRRLQQGGLQGADHAQHAQRACNARMQGRPETVGSGAGAAARARGGATKR